jgi:uncharacterized Zn finger protein
MGWYYGFKPYVSVAERRRKAQRELEKRRKKGHAVEPIVIDGRTISRTFWGKAWCDNLESYSDYANRLPRGRSYVRNGSVVHLEIAPGKITAMVSGSELYKIELTISPLRESRWTAIKKECGGQIGSLVELLQGRLSEKVMEVVTRRGGGLFPEPSEIKLSCSCPDWADMCKHVAAVMYGVGARLDAKPELLFLLRKVDHLELIAGAVDSAPTGATGKARAKKTIATGDLSGIFGIELADEEAHAEATSAAATRSPRRRAASTRAGKKQTPRRSSAKGSNTSSTSAQAAGKGKSKSAAPKKRAGAKASSRKRSKAATS